MTKQFNGIFFDLGWTLEIPETGDWMLTKKFREYYPLEMQQSVDRTVWRNALMKASQPLIEHHQMRTRKEEEDAFTGFYYDLIANAGLTITEEIAREISHDRTYVYEPKYILLPDVRDMLVKLREQNYRLGIISDTWPSTVQRLEQYGIADLFDCQTYSYQLGVFKPDPQLYHDALKKLGLPAQQCVFVDDLPGNLEAASKLGIHPVQSLVKPGTKADPRFDSVSRPSELLELLNRKCDQDVQCS